MGKLTQAQLICLQALAKWNDWTDFNINIHSAEALVRRGLAERRGIIGEKWLRAPEWRITEQGRAALGIDTQPELPASDEWTPQVGQLVHLRMDADFSDVIPGERAALEMIRANRLVGAVKKHTSPAFATIVDFGIFDDDEYALNMKVLEPYKGGQVVPPATRGTLVQKRDGTFEAVMEGETLPPYEPDKDAQIAALKAEVEALKERVQTMAFALEPFMQYYARWREESVNYTSMAQWFAMEVDPEDFVSELKAASEVFDSKPTS